MENIDIQIAQIAVAKSQPPEYDLARSEQAYACCEGLKKESRGKVLAPEGLGCEGLVVRAYVHKSLSQEAWND